MLKELVLFSLVTVVFYTIEAEANDYKYSIAYNPKGYASYKCPKNYRRTDLDFKNRGHWTLMRWGTKDNPACAIRNTKAKCFSKDGHKKNWVTFSNGYGEFHISKHEHFSDMSSSQYYPKYHGYHGKKWPSGKKLRGYNKKGRYYGRFNGYGPSSYRYSSSRLHKKKTYPYVSNSYSSNYKKGYPHSSGSYGWYNRRGKGKKYNKKGKGKKGRYSKKYGGYKYPSSYRGSSYHSYDRKGHSYYPSSGGSYYNGPSSNSYGYSNPRGSSYSGHHGYSSGSYGLGGSNRGYKYPGSSFPLSYGSSSKSSNSYSNTAIPVNFSVRALYFKVRGVTDIEIKFHGPVSKTIRIKKGKELDPRKKTWICIQFETFPVFREIWFTFKFGLNKKAKFWDLYLFSCCENLKDKINFD